jgi:hypothetical protein
VSHGADDAIEDAFADSPIDAEHNKETGIGKFELLFGAAHQEVGVEITVLLVIKGEW